MSQNPPPSSPPPLDYEPQPSDGSARSNGSGEFVMAVIETAGLLSVIAILISVSGCFVSVWARGQFAPLAYLAVVLGLSAVVLRWVIKRHRRPQWPPLKAARTLGLWIAAGVGLLIIMIGGWIAMLLSGGPTDGP